MSLQKCFIRWQVGLFIGVNKCGIIWGAAQETKSAKRGNFVKYVVEAAKKRRNTASLVQSRLFNL